MAVFLASFLVLFLEVALIRWMPAYIRLLACRTSSARGFLGIGVGYYWRFPAASVALFRSFRLSSSPRYACSGSSGGPDLWQHLFSAARQRTSLLSARAAAAAVRHRGRALLTLAQRGAGNDLCRRCGCTINLVGSLAGVVAFGDLLARAVADVVVRRGVPGSSAVGVDRRRGEGEKRRNRRKEKDTTQISFAILPIQGYCSCPSCSSTSWPVALWSPLQDYGGSGRPRHRG
jgi:hypothetical protein